MGRLLTVGNPTVGLYATGEAHCGDRPTSSYLSSVCLLIDCLYVTILTSLGLARVYIRTRFSYLAEELHLVLPTTRS